MIPTYRQLQKSHQLHLAMKKVEKWVNSSDEETDTGTKIVHDECLSRALPPVKFSAQADLIASRLRSKKSSVIPLKEIEQEAQRLYKVVLEAIGGDAFLFSSLNFSDSQKQAIIQALKSSGFNVGPSDFTDIIRIAKIMRNIHEEPQGLANFLFPPETNLRDASLNCYDYMRLKKEMYKLQTYVGFDKLDEFCPTLMNIYSEALHGEENEYPGRHLPFTNYKGRGISVYIQLKLLDEIFFTTPYPLKNIFDVNRAIDNTKKKYGLKKEIKLSDSSFRKRCMSLSNLINVEHSWGEKNQYNRSVFEKGNVGHMYRQFNDNWRLCAFMVDISLKEMFMLRNEISRLHAEMFSNRTTAFKNEFPLISSLGYMGEPLDPEVNNGITTNGVPETDLLTVNYRPIDNTDLFKKAKDMVALKLPFTLFEENGTVKLIPLEVKRKRSDWSLIARYCNGSGLRIIKPEELANIIAMQTTEADAGIDKKLATQIIGISPLIWPRPIEVTLEVKMSKLTKDFVFRELSPVFTKVDKIPKNQEFERGNLVSFSVYVNNDFLNALLQLDKVGKLINIEPQELSDLYENFYEEKFGSPRIPLSDRAKSMKRLRLIE